MAGAVDEKRALEEAENSPAWPAWTWRRSSLPTSPTNGPKALGARQGLPPQRKPRFHVVAYDYGIKRNILRMIAGPRRARHGRPSAASRKDLKMNPTACFSPTAGRPGAVRLRHRGDRRDPRRDADPGVRHLPRPPADGPRLGREDAQDEVRPPRREPPGEGPRYRAVVITSQNHGFAVDPASLTSNLDPLVLFDGSLQGLARTDRPAFLFQGHPEASRGRMTSGTCSTASPN